MPRFERGGLPKATDDRKGQVRVSLRLIAKAGPGTGQQTIKGNICRNLTVGDAKVSEVMEAIIDCLFGEGDDEPDE